MMSRKVTISKFKKCDNVSKNYNPKIYEVWQCPEKSQFRNLRNEKTSRKVQSQNIRNKTISGKIIDQNEHIKITCISKFKRKISEILWNCLHVNCYHIISMYYKIKILGLWLFGILLHFLNFGIVTFRDNIRVFQFWHIFFISLHVHQKNILFLNILSYK